MKKIKLGIILLTIAFLATSVQNIIFAWSAPGVSKAVCGYCEKENGHETWCPSYRAEQQSTKLKEHVPMPELVYIPSTCPLCGGTNGTHINGGEYANASGQCYIGYALEQVQHYREEYNRATTLEQEKQAVFDLEIWNDNINRYLQAAKGIQKKKEQQQNQQVTNQNVQQINTQPLGRNAAVRNKMRQDMNTARQQQPQPQTQQAQEYTYKPAINLPLADNKTASSFVVDGVEYDKRITFHIDNAAVAYGKTDPNGTENWILKDSAGNTLLTAELGDVSTVEYNDQHYFLIKSQKYGYHFYDSYGKEIPVYSYKEPEPVYRRVPVDNNVYEDRMFFIMYDEVLNGYYVYDPVTDKKVSDTYGNIEKNALGMSQNFPRFKVLKKGFYGVAEIGSYMLIIPAQYTFIKEYYTANEKFPYYIVSKVANKYGAYNYNGQLVIPLNFSLSEVEKKIASKNFK